MLIMPNLFFMCLVTCKPNTTEESGYLRLFNQKRMLNEYAVGALNNKGTEKDMYLRLFFKSFPDDFVTFHKIYGSHDLNYSWYSHLRVESIKAIYGSHDLNYPPDLRRSGYFLHDILPELYTLVPVEQYYVKMIGVGIGGFWEADDVGAFSHHLREFIPENITLTINVLAKYDEKEVKSFWYFLYDGPHPEHPYKRTHYEELHARISSINPKMAEKLKEAYEQLLSESDEHGH